MLQPIVKPAPDFTPVTSKRPRSCPCSPESSHQRHANSSSSTSNAAPSLGLASLSSAQAPKLNDLTTPHQQTRHRAPDSAVAAASLPAMQPPTIPVIAIEAIIGVCRRKIKTNHTSANPTPLHDIYFVFPLTMSIISDSFCQITHTLTEFPIHPTTYIFFKQAQGRALCLRRSNSALGTLLWWSLSQ